MKAIEDNSLTLAIGPAGTGKTYLAICAAVEMFESGKVDRIILTRPAIEAGESIGYLPGDLQEKMAPYLRPLYDALNDRLGAKRLKHLLDIGEIEIAPVGYMRGRTLNNAFVVIDEAQNCTFGQLTFPFDPCQVKILVFLSNNRIKRSLYLCWSWIKDREVTGSNKHRHATHCSANQPGLNK